MRNDDDQQGTGLFGMIGKLVKDVSEKGLDGAGMDMLGQLVQGVMGGSDEAEASEDENSDLPDDTIHRGGWGGDDQQVASNDHDDDDDIDGYQDDDSALQNNVTRQDPVAYRDDSDDSSSSLDDSDDSGATSELTVTVRPGDSLSRIAARTLGDASRWEEIFDENRDLIDDPNLIYPGQVLRLPG